MEECDLEIYFVHMCMGSFGLGGALPDFMENIFFLGGELFNQFIATP